jgi:putative ATP-dependent endonuclease of the OLD family
MYISRIYIRNYRNFKELDIFIPDGEPLTIIGRNSSGKTNLLSAIRLVLDASVPPWEKKLVESDFCRANGWESWRQGEEIVITITFSGVGEAANDVAALLRAIAPMNASTDDDASLKICLQSHLSFVYAPTKYSPGKEYDLNYDYEAFSVSGRCHPSGNYYDERGQRIAYSDEILKVRHAATDASDFYKFFYWSPEDTENVIKDRGSIFEKKFGRYGNGKIRRHLNVLFLDALRDVKKDFHYGYHSLLSQLIRASVKTFDNIQVMRELTEGLEAIRDSETIPTAKGVFDSLENQMMNDTVSFLGNEEALKVGTPRIDLENIGRYYNFLVSGSGGPSSEELDRVGLGKQNLAYISAIFALFELKKAAFSPDGELEVPIIYNLLLIEEPEAHLDVQSQKYLHTQVEQKTSLLHQVVKNTVVAETDAAGKVYTQVIQSSHSTHLTSKASLKNILVVERLGDESRAINIDQALRRDSINYMHNRRIIRQYLDATRSAFLFGRKVILVEGLSEKYALTTLVNIHLKFKSGLSGDIDSHGIEIVEVAGKNFAPFESLFQDIAGEPRLGARCLVIRDGDKGDNVIMPNNYATIYRAINTESPGSAVSNVRSNSNLFTFEIDLFFLPKSDSPDQNNVPYLKAILQKLFDEGLYYVTVEKLNEKLEEIDVFQQKVSSEGITKADADRLLKNIKYGEATKPNISLYLASLLKAKYLSDSVELDSWRIEADQGLQSTKIEDLPKFVVPTYIKDGIEWLTTEVFLG